MPPEPPIDEEDYASSEDSDFAPEDAPDHVSSAESDDEAEAEAAHGDGEQIATAPKRKREGTTDGNVEAEDAGFENSGDEAVIGKGKKKRRRRDKDQKESDGEEGGIGGFVKTRSQRANEKAERRAATVRGPVTVDVDALWAQMTAGPKQGSATTVDGGEGSGSQGDVLNLAAVAAAAAAAAAASRPDDGDDIGMVKIRRTYNFAGKVHTEEKLVARDSAEAKLYLASLAGTGGQEAAGTSAGAAVDGAAGDGDSGRERLPPRKAFRSVFEPVIPAPQSGSAQNGSIPPRRTDLDLGVQARLLARERAAHETAKKLNTVEMSRMDWAGFVDKEGIQDELALAGKAKGSYAEQQLFLARSEAIREDEARRARLAGKV